MNAGLIIVELGLFSFLIETVVEILKPLYQPLVDRFGEKIPFSYYMSILLGIAGALVFTVNGLEMFGLSNNAIVGQVITGLLCSRGSNFVHEVYRKLRTIVKPEVEEVVIVEPEINVEG